MHITETVSTVAVAGSAMEVFLFIPEIPQGQSSIPAIVLAQHLPVGHTGIENDEFTLATARRLANAGYAVAVPFLFHWWPKTDDMDSKRAASRDDHMLADMTAAFSLLQKNPAVDAARIAIVGHCWGGRVAWLAACHLPECAALAVFYGGNIKKGLDPDSTPPIALSSHIKCPVMGFFGNEDTNPSPADVDDYEQALKQAGVPYEFHRYDGAGHAFQNFPNPERYHKAASADAWNKLIPFLHRQLMDK